MDIPFNEPYIGKEEEQSLMKALRSKHLRGDGPYTQRVQKYMEDWLGLDHVLLTTSCTHALEMAMLVLGIGRGEEVIMPSFNFVSSANAAVLAGAEPVFAEVCPETMNLEPEDLERKITERTKAIVPVHYAGVACDMDAVMEIADRYDLYVVEDAAQGVDAYYDGKPLGTIGDIGCYSFHDTKNITCGEGGAFLTNDPELAQRAEIVREKGTNRAAFIRGEVDKYTWVDKGSSYIPSDLLISLLESQLQKREEIKTKRRDIWEQYYELLAPYEENLMLPVIPEKCNSNYHIFHFLARNIEQQEQLIESFKQEGIPATFHYVPLHNAPFFKSHFDSTEPLQLTAEYSNRLIRLPLYPELDATDAYFGRISKAIEQVI